jgi:hypothetical protein
MEKSGVVNMVMYIVISLIAIAKALMDIVSFREANMIFPKSWGVSVSWKNKWKKDSEGKVLVGQERFWLSSTVLVFLTDVWHLAGMIQRLLIFSLISYLQYGLSLKMGIYTIVLFIVHAVVFHVFYIYIFIRKK